ncbi:MAG: TonB-dependent receptor [Sphingomicrobium sp.]
MRNIRTVGRASLFLMSIGGAAPALAQATAPSAASPAPDASRADALGSSDIIVTARRREERVQAIPVAISAFTGASLAARGVDRIDGVAGLTPNMTFQNNPGFGSSSNTAAIYIRGIGQKEFLPTTDPGVGVYVDGIYIARSVGALLDLVDVARVEVLRGPQGTLFGRNTIGGAISVTTVKPGPNFSASGQVTTGSFNRLDVKGTVNLPLGETLFLRASGGYLSRDGYVLHVADGRKLGNVNTRTGRVALRWQASPTFEVNVAADITTDHSNGPAFTLAGVDYRSRIFNPNGLPVLPPGSAPRAGFYVANPPFDAPPDNFTLLSNYLATFLGGQPCLSFSPYSPQGSAQACYGDRFISSTTESGTAPQYSRNRIWGTSATIDWYGGAVQLKSITAYRKSSGGFARDADHSPLTIAHFGDPLLTDGQFSQELQLLGTAADRKLNYVFGLYYFNERGNDVNVVDFTPIYFQSGGKFGASSYAAFGQGTYRVGRVDLTAGLRYTRDRKTFFPDQTIFLDRTGGALIALSPNTPQTRILPYVEVKRSEGAFTPMANVAWHASDLVMLYGSYAQGFKSGGFVQRVFPPLAATPQFAAEKAAAVELGFKSQLFGKRLTLNGALFYTKYDNLQVQVFTGVAPVTKNAAKADIRGAEIEARLAPGGGWFVEASGGYLDPNYTAIDPSATEITTRSKFERISKWTLSASLLKSFELGKLELTPRVDYSYRSGFFMDALNTVQLYQPGYGVVNASVALDFAHKRLSLIGGVSNLTDNHFLETGVYSATFGQYETMFTRGREFTLTLKART